MYLDVIIIMVAGVNSADYGPLTNCAHKGIHGEVGLVLKCPDCYCSMNPVYKASSKNTRAVLGSESFHLFFVALLLLSALFLATVVH